MPTRANMFRYVLATPLALAMLAGTIASGAATLEPPSPAASTPIHEKLPPPKPLRIKGEIPRWDEGIPLGNGRFGVLVWGQGRRINLSLDRADLWDTRIPETLKRPDWTYETMKALKESRQHARHVELFDVPYDTIPYPTKLPVARIEITLPEGESITEWSLTPGEAYTDLTLEAPAMGLMAPMYVRVDHDESIVTSGSLPRDATAIIRWPEGLKKLQYAEPTHGSDTITGSGGNIRRTWTVQETLEGLRYVVVLGIGDGKPPHKGMPYRRTLAAAVATSRDHADPLAHALSLVEDACDVHRSRNQPARGVRAAAFAQSQVSIPDARLQQQYDLCKHYYISGSRPDAPPLALQGVWTADEGGLPPWKGDYHNDLNTQMTYLAVHTAGLMPQGASWLNFNSKLLPEYRDFASTFYGLKQDPATVAPAIVPGVMTIDGKAIGGWGQHSLSPTHSAWVAHSFYMHWRYTKDREFLIREARPFCEGVAAGLRGLLTLDANGELKLPLSTSPEIHDNSYEAWLPPNSNYDQSLLRFIFAACAEMASEMGDEQAAGLWRDTLAKLGPLDVDDATGLTFAKGHPYDQSHRHFSHAMAIHPLGTLTSMDGPEAVRTINATLDQLKAKSTDWWCGYSFSWAACMAARSGRSDEALDYLTKYLAFTGPNGFHLNGDQTKSGLSKFTYRPFTLEGNFLAMQAIHEMLLQSWHEIGTLNARVIRIFPATPHAWSDVSFRDLRAEGGWKVSADRSNHTNYQFTLHSEQGGTVLVKDPFAIGTRWFSKKPIQTHESHRAGGIVWEFKLDPNEVLHVRNTQW